MPVVPDRTCADYQCCRTYQWDLRNQRGALATIASVISEAESNIDNVIVDERDGGYTNLRLTIEVTDRQHLARIIRRLRQLEMVERINRINN